jgi:hypothetical protein
MGVKFMDLLVLESAWDNQSLDDVSVWPFFKEFSNVIGINAYYKPFSDAKSLKHWIELYDESPSKNQKVLYIASHGSDARIFGLNKAINFSSVLQILEECVRITHVVFGCCSFGGKENLVKIIESSECIKFASGYEKIIDWIDSTLFDLLVLRMIHNNDSRALHTKIYSLMDEKSQGIANDLQFKFAYKFRGKIEGSIRISDYDA